MNRFRPTPIPERVSPLVRKLFAEMNAQQCTDRMMADRSGVSKFTISDWRHRTSPNLPNLEACLNVLGFELTLRRTRDPQ